jgi:peptide/nickel transport system ATP-binding protein
MQIADSENDAIPIAKSAICNLHSAVGLGLAVQDEHKPLLSVRDLRTYFHPDEGTVKAVDGASFDVAAGQTLGIVGESGCGKSVCARSILRIVERPGRIEGGQILWRRERPDGSVVEVDLARLDADGQEMRAIRGAEVSLIFQEPMTSFSPVHTIGDQIGEMLRIHRRAQASEIRPRVIELLRHVGIPRPEQRCDEYAYQLSGGLRQRAMIAMALACKPRLLIADEPTTALDVTTQAQILDLLHRLQAEHHMAIILITHNLGVVAEMADEVAVMYLGRVVEKGPVDAIFHNPKHPYTRALLRSIPTIDAPARQMLPTLSGSIPHPYNRPAGCPFHPRCPDFLPGVCDRHEPGLGPVADGHEVSCFLYHPPADIASPRANGHQVVREVVS